MSNFKTSAQQRNNKQNEKATYRKEKCMQNIYWIRG